MDKDEKILDQDTELMLRFKNGDPDAFSILFEKYYSKVVNLCWRYIQNNETAQDAAQEIFLKVYQKALNYTPNATFSTYIYRVTVNHCLNVIRDSKKHAAFSLDQNLSESEENQNIPINYIASNELSPRDMLQKKETDKLVKNAIDSLPPKQRMAVILKRFDNLSYDDIAKVMNCSVGAVDSLLQRARVLLTENLGKFFK
jgi:RNA polymerase sigma-70 factor, ECF subfamily